MGLLIVTLSWQDGRWVVPSGWHDPSLPPNALLCLQNRVSELPGGETGRPRCWTSHTHLWLPSATARGLKHEGRKNRGEGGKPTTAYIMLVPKWCNSPLRLQEESCEVVPGFHPGEAKTASSSPQTPQPHHHWNQPIQNHRLSSTEVF